MSRALAVFLAALATPALAAAPRPIQLAFPRFTVPSHSDREVCTFVRLKRREAIELAGSAVVNLGGRQDFTSHHFILWAYTGKDVDSFARNKVVDSKACLDFGPADRNSRSLIRIAQAARTLEILPAGLAARIETADSSHGKVIGFILNSHWINSSDRPQHASVKVKLIPARPHTVKRHLLQIFEATANAMLDTPPGEVSKAATWAWGPGQVDFGGAVFVGAVQPKGVACVTSVTAHMHKRGKHFEVELVDADGHASPFFSTDAYSDPGQRQLDPPQLIRPGEKLRYTCTHDNGVTTTQKLGCEEEAGVAPGHSLLYSFLHGTALQSAPKDCHADADCTPTDPAFPTRHFSGRCVPAHLVFGFTSNDDMCILPGTYYDAVPNAAPGHECDLGPLPVIN
jgi:hypothetical protein